MHPNWIKSANGACRCVEELRGLFNGPQLGKRSALGSRMGDIRGSFEAWLCDGLKVREVMFPLAPPPLRQPRLHARAATPDARGR